MKARLILILTLLPCLVFCQEEQGSAANEIYTIVEVPPKFGGGDKDIYKFLKKNSKFRITSKRAKGVTVFYQFVVNEEGEVKNIKFLKKTPSNIENEIIRLLDLMPMWTPGYQNDKAVSVRLTKELTFIFE